MKGLTLVSLALTLTFATAAFPQDPRYNELANQPFQQSYPTEETTQRLMDELLFERGVQSYLWALPAINMWAMKQGSEARFGAGYNILPVWKERLNARTLVTTPNSDVIYAMGYVDLGNDGPLVIEVPPGQQGILDDFWQRPIRMVGQFEGRDWSGDVGLPGPDKGKGGKYLVLPPDYSGDTPSGYFTYRSRTYGVFVFWRGFFQDPKQLDAPVKVMEQTKIYPLGKEASANAVPGRVGRSGQHAVCARRQRIRDDQARHRRRIRRSDGDGHARHAGGHWHCQG